MNKFLALFAAVAVSAAFGAANDTLLTFSTPGIDKYADGRRVLDGECYALVWTKDGATFGGIAADGKLLSENDKLTVRIPVFQKKCSNISKISISPYCYGIPSGMRKAIKPVDRMVADTYDFRKRCHLLVDSFW